MFYSEEAQREFQADQEQAAMTQGEYMREALFQHTCVYGEDRADEAWILSPFDTWEANPHYTGPARAHPEDEDGCHQEWLMETQAGHHAVTLYEDHLEALRIAQHQAADYAATDDDVPF